MTTWEGKHPWEGAENIIEIEYALTADPRQWRDPKPVTSPRALPPASFGTDRFEH